MAVTFRAQLAAALPAGLVDELLEAHAEAKRNFFLGGLRLSAVEGGRFCEAAFRILEWITTGTFTALGTSLDTDRLITRLANTAKTAHPDAIRLHIPRALRLVYDIRNNRDAAHLADGIDPNMQDATLVVSVVDWVLAEVLRLYHNVTADEAQRMVVDGVTRAIPSVEEFGGQPKLLLPHLQAGDAALVLLYHRGSNGATLEQLSAWLPPRMRANLKRTLQRLEHDRAFAHLDGNTYRITRAGQAEAEIRKLLEPRPR